MGEYCFCQTQAVSFYILSRRNSIEKRTLQKPIEIMKDVLEIFESSTL